MDPPSPSPPFGLRSVKAERNKFPLIELPLACSTGRYHLCRRYVFLFLKYSTVRTYIFPSKLKQILTLMESVKHLGLFRFLNGFLFSEENKFG